MNYRIGIDLGGTKIEVIALSQDHEVLFNHRAPTPQGDYQGTIKQIVELVEQTELHLASPATSIGIGIPGAISPATGLIKNANSTCLIGKPLHLDLRKHLNRPVKLANDADCFTLSEASDGAAAGYKSVFGVILGTGVGGGIFINGQLLTGPNSITGEWGHNPLPWPGVEDGLGRQCYCGKADCIETFLSGPGFSQNFNSSNQSSLSPSQIWQEAQTGHVQAQLYCQRYILQLAKSLASVINILDPEVIVLGGGMSNIEALYTEVPTALEQFVFSDKVSTPLLKAKHGDSSGVRGAAWL